jgi:hypothetical protein
LRIVLAGAVVDAGAVDATLLRATVCVELTADRCRRRVVAGRVIVARGVVVRV